MEEGQVSSDDGERSVVSGSHKEHRLNEMITKTI